MSEDEKNYRCPVCSCSDKPIDIHGHTQCPNCHSVGDGDCCQGKPLD